jgi:hypothetical protein
MSNAGSPESALCNYLTDEYPIMTLAHGWRPPMAKQVTEFTKTLVCILGALSFFIGMIFWILYSVNQESWRFVCGIAMLALGLRLVVWEG